MTIAYWQDTSPEHTPLEVDVLIIGAGIAGWSTAYWLREAGMRVAVVDRGDLCAGASGRNAGFVTCGSVEHYSRQVARHDEAKARDLWRYSEDNLRLIEEELVAQGAACDFRRRGTWSLAGSEHELAELTRSCRLMVEAGIRVEMHDEALVRRELGAQGFHGGALYVDDGEVHPVKLVRAIAERSGAAFHPHHEVHEIDAASGDTVVVRTQRRTFHAASVVLATNGYSAQLDRWFEDKIYPTRGQILVTDPVAAFMGAPCYCNFVLDYFRQLPDGRVLIGGFRQLEKESEVGTADVVNAPIQEALEAFLAAHFEALRGTRIAYRWSGVMGFSADGVPLIGALPGRPNVYFVGGFTGHGIGFGFRAGQLLARLMLHGEVPKHLSARRFG